MQLKTITPPLGLCQDCLHRQPIESAKGSLFQLCRVGLEDPTYPKYPRLPVLRCPAHTPKK